MVLYQPFPAASILVASSCNKTSKTEEQSQPYLFIQQTALDYKFKNNLETKSCWN